MFPLPMIHCQCHGIHSNKAAGFARLFTRVLATSVWPNASETLQLLNVTRPTSASLRDMSVAIGDDDVRQLLPFLDSEVYMCV